MSLFGDLANLVFLAVALVAGVLALVYYSRYAKVADRISALEAEAASQQAKSRSLSEDLEKSRKEVGRLSRLAASAGVEQSRLEAPRTDGGVRADKKKVDRAPELKRIKELELQADDLRRQLENAQRQLKTRDADVRHLKEELETVQVALADLTRPAHRPGPHMEEDEPQAAAPVVGPTPPPAAPVVPAIDPELLEQRVQEARKQLEAAERIRHEAAGRANLAELETRRTKERLERIDKRAHELLERLVATEREYRTAQREVDAYRRMYMGLKGRFDVARDTLLSFQQKFGVPLPTEIGVELYSDMEEYLELEEEERSRPRNVGRSRRGDRDREERGQLEGSGAAALETSIEPSAAEASGAGTEASLSLAGEARPNE